MQYLVDDLQLGIAMFDRSKPLIKFGDIDLARWYIFMGMSSEIGRLQKRNLRLQELNLEANGY